MTNSNMDVIYAEMVTKVQQVRFLYIYCKHYVSICLFHCVSLEGCASSSVKVTEPRSLCLSYITHTLNMSKHVNGSALN